VAVAVIVPLSVEKAVEHLLTKVLVVMIGVTSK
jgi:hypothetical protein